MSGIDGKLPAIDDETPERLGIPAVVEGPRRRGRSSTPDVDLQATISEVRPDGNETFVQNGWLRASERKLSTNSANMFKPASTALEPIFTFTAADASPMPADQFVKVVVPLY